MAEITGKKKTKHLRKKVDTEQQCWKLEVLLRTVDKWEEVDLWIILHWLLNINKPCYRSSLEGQNFNIALWQTWVEVQD